MAGRITPGFIQKIMNHKVLKYNISILFGACILFVPFLGAVHLFDWDEINFAECAREMLVTKNYLSVQINFQPFWEKPPLFIWMQAFSMNIFGINAFAARLPNAICGVTTLLFLFNTGRTVVSDRFGLIWTLVYASSLLPHLYFKSGIIDPWFNLFTFSGIWYFILLTQDHLRGVRSSRNTRLLVLSALYIGLAVLTKGPVAALIFALCVGVYWVVRRFRPVISLRQILFYVTAVALAGGLWFLPLLVTGHGSTVAAFFDYQLRLFSTGDAGHRGPFVYHWIVLLVGCFPMSAFAIQSFRRNEADTIVQRHFKLWMMILFWVVLILFSIVQTKIVHYSSLCYFPLSFLGAYVVYKLMTGEMKWRRLTGILLMVIASILGIMIMAVSLVDRYKEQVIRRNWIHDKFAVGNLAADGGWSGYEWLLGAVLIVGTGTMLVLIRGKHLKCGLAGIFVISLFTVNVTTLAIAPGIEGYSQAAAIEFYRSVQGKDCYVETLGFKSYAQLFYFGKKEPTGMESYNQGWLLTGRIDKPAYFVCKITSLEGIVREYPGLKELSRKNGFVFLVRMPE